MDDQGANLEELFAEMREIQQRFLKIYGVNDIWSNSKIYEVLQANTLGHKLIPGHSGSLDACDDLGNEFEYKHFKQTSSNHSWTFNDYSDTTIQKLNEKVEAVYFAHVDDETYPPRVDWTYEASGTQIAIYLDKYTAGMKNARRMINISAKQLEERENLSKKLLNSELADGVYGVELVRIFQIISELESKVGVSNILTSSKFWEVLVSLPLGHQVNSEQGGRAGAHDAVDKNGGDYEYKVSSSKSWSFQDISPTVLKKYLECEGIILAIVDKTNIKVAEVWLADPKNVVPRLKQKLEEKDNRYNLRAKPVRRQQVSLSAGDLERIEATKII